MATETRGDPKLAAGQQEVARIADKTDAGKVEPSRTQDDDREGRPQATKPTEHEFSSSRGRQSERAGKRESHPRPAEEREKVRGRRDSSWEKEWPRSPFLQESVWRTYTYVADCSNRSSLREFDRSRLPFSRPLERDDGAGLRPKTREATWETTYLILRRPPRSAWMSPVSG